MNKVPRFRDPRHYQIAVLSLLVAYGVFVLDFGVRSEQMLAGWDIEDIRDRIAFVGPATPDDPKPWWQRLRD